MWNDLGWKWLHPLTDLRCDISLELYFESRVESHKIAILANLVIYVE